MSKSKVVGVVALLAAALGAPAGRASAARFEFPSEGKTNRIQFESKAPMESFTGKTSKVSGYVVLDPARLAESIQVHVEVPLATLDTGIDLRNQHMREEHLQTDKYPNAVFEGASVDSGAGAALEAGKTVTILVGGTFDLHGVTKTIHVPVDLTWTPGAAGDPAGATLRAVARFQVKLSDYSIPRPQFLVMKLDEVQRVTFDVTANAKP